MTNELQTAVAPPQARVSLIAKVAARYSVEPAKLLDTLKGTAFKGEQPVNNEQMMALLIVADQYGLNPFTRELFAFPDKKGIVPVVSVDGWARIINEHPQLDGIIFDVREGSMGLECECTIYRKDRAHPTRVTEYLAECKRGTGPWGSHPRRMLRHKALIQCARVAFGFGGIVDEDEAQRIIETKDMGAADVVQPPSSSAQAVRAQLKSTAPPPPHAEVIEAEPQTAPSPAPAWDAAYFSAHLAGCKDAEVGALILDEAREHLNEAEQAELAAQWKTQFNPEK